MGESGLNLQPLIFLFKLVFFFLTGLTDLNFFSTSTSVAAAYSGLGRGRDGLVGGGAVDIHGVVVADG